METQFNHRDLFCPTETALGVLGGKWKGMILWCLCQRTMRFGELQKTIPGVTQRMLTKQLRELEDYDIIIRKIYPQVPPKVEYSLSDHGKALRPILEQLEAWSQAYINSKVSGTSK